LKNVCEIWGICDLWEEAGFSKRTVIGAAQMGCMARLSPQIRNFALLGSGEIWTKHWPTLSRICRKRLTSRYVSQKGASFFCNRVGLRLRWRISDRLLSYSLTVLDYGCPLLWNCVGLVKRWSRVTCQERHSGQIRQMSRSFNPCGSARE
jgi:hypothetical protein